MRLRRIALTDVRGFGPRVEVELAPEGVTVIEAPNEAGKSTLFDAVDVALRYKDGSKHRDVKSLWPVDRDAPCTVEVELTCGRTHLVLTRTYRRNPSTTLEVLAPARATLSGDEAHDRLRQILDTEVDDVLYEALRFTQGRELDALALGSSDALTAALDRAAGGASGPDDGALWERVEQEYRHWFTASGREREPLTGPRAEYEAAEAELEELERREAELAGDAEALAAIEQELPSLESERDERLEPELVRLQATRREVDEARTRLATAESEVARTSGELERVRERQARRAERRGERDALADEVDTLQEGLEPGRRRLHELRERAGEAESAWATVHEQVASAGRGRELAQLRLERFDAAASLRLLEERRRRAAELRDATAAAEDDLATDQLGDAEVARLEEAERAVQLARARLNVGAPQLRVAPRRAVRIELDGEQLDLPSGTPFDAAIASRFVLDDPDLGRLEVAPGDQAGALRDALDRAEAAQTRLLAELGVEGLADAHERRDRCRTVRAALDQDRRELERVLDGQDLDTLTADERQARAQLQRLDGRIDALVAADGPADPTGDRSAAPSGPRERSALLTARDAAVDAERRLQREVEGARGTRDAAAAEVAEQHTTVEVAAAAFEERRRRLDRLDDELAAARAQEDDAALDAAVQRATDAHAACLATVDTARAALDALDPDLVDFEHERLTRASQAVADRLVELGQRAAQLRGSLAVRGQDGLGEQLQLARDRVDRARQGHERAQARAAAAALLHETLAQAREQAYRAYRAPLRDAISGLAHKLYGREVRLELDDGLGVSHRTLDGVTLAFEQLSAGAREQLAILTGLAAAQLAGEDGVPFVLDDALGYTDRTRLERLGALLGRTDGAQVIVLTCLADRFRHVGNARMVALHERRRAAADQPTLDSAG